MKKQIEKKTIIYRENKKIADGVYLNERIIDENNRTGEIVLITIYSSKRSE